MKTFKSARPIEILLVEDNEGDVQLTREALRAGKIHNNLMTAGDGLEALEVLRRQGAHASAKQPDLILLDLNMPRMGGREFLSVVKSDDRLKVIPVVILTTSSAEEDIHETYDHHANCYIRKPMNYQQFINVVHVIEEFWLTVVTLPLESPTTAFR